jgi:hypothetical protein
MHSERKYMAERNWTQDLSSYIMIDGTSSVSPSIKFRWYGMGERNSYTIVQSNVYTSGIRSGYRVYQRKFLPISFVFMNTVRGMSNCCWCWGLTGQQQKQHHLISGKDSGKQFQSFGCLITILPHETCWTGVHVTNTGWRNMATSNTKKVTVIIMIL